ncbi:GntR family transcriptional regulator [Curtobacterium caseinilyticum]|uniref:GntR family transcriptional regulator n=1 Tax=Curtobacterium caseinilyticum TaxID=3055137 RepID=A0ABT7TM69_9MICO|nr:GntR family transcriptional regulator [Curtobacterium caseinilyticum]MDM7890675.1 GntR family transcriptional regulator [Curtobacterium caseinilyticum]
MEPSSSSGSGRVPDPSGIRRSLLRDAVFLKLLENVLRGVYRRGQRLRLDDIAKDMQVSRTPVREALVPLESLRLVSVQRYVGVVVAPWSVGQMVERLRVARAMIAEPAACGQGSGEPFDAHVLRSCLTEAGAFVELGAWYLRRRGAVVSADWMIAQRPVLDAFFTDDVAAANGIDAVVGRRARVRQVERAVAAAEHDRLDVCASELVGLADDLIALPDRFRSAA